MIKIKASYENDEEFKKFLSLLQDKASKIKQSKNNEGRFKKAYITIKDHD